MGHVYKVFLLENDMLYIGDITVQQPIMYPQQQLIVIDDEPYSIGDARVVPSGIELYVTKVQSAKLDNKEVDFDVLTKTLGDIMNFLRKHDIKSIYSKDKVQLNYTYPLLKDRVKDFQAVGGDLTGALVVLRNGMIARGLIKRGEW